MTGFLLKNPLAYEELTVADTVIELTPVKYLHAQTAFITIEGGEMRIRVDGGTPSATVGHLMYGGNLKLTAGGVISKFKAIRAGTESGKLTITYFG